MVKDVTFLLYLPRWKIIVNDLNNQIIDSPGALTTLLGADEQYLIGYHLRYLVPGTTFAFGTSSSYADSISIDDWRFSPKNPQRTHIMNQVRTSENYKERYMIRGITRVSLRSYKRSSGEIQGARYLRA